MADSMEKEKEEQARNAHARAEKCFLAGDVSAARQWMQSAVSLAPDLPGTPQIVAAYDVHAAAARGRRNWYGVLGLKPGHADHDDIKKQYRRLCLLVHPDKNPSAAADGAFKLIHAAWDALSARHPPLGTAVTAPANQPRPPPPQRKQAPPTRPPEPKPRPPKPKPRPPKPKPSEPKQRPPKPEPKPPEPKQKPPKPEPKQKPDPEPKQKPPKPKWQPQPPKPKPQPKPKPEPKQRPPKPQPQPQPQPRRRPARQRSAWPEPPTSSSQSQQENLKQDNRCSKCGAQSFNCRSNRCLSCQWSPMDGRRHQPRDYDDRMHDPYEDDYDYDYAFNDFLNKEDDFFDC